MTYARRSAVACCLMALVVMLSGPVSGASASKASIKAALKSYDGKIAVAEGHTLSAIGEYKTTKNATPVEKAITASVTVLSALRTKISHQSAGPARVKAAKSKLVKGLEAVIVSYGKLKTAFSLQSSNPEAAQAEVTKALAAVKSGRKKLNEAAKLLQ